MQIHQIGGLGPDCNIYLIIDGVITLIDAGTGQNFKIVEQNLGKFSIKPGDVNLLINTHCHYDHAGGDRDFVDAGCEVAIHESEARLLRGGEETTTCAAIFGERLRPVKATRELRGGNRIELGELTLEVLHTPGHTRGSISLYEPERKLLFSGDTVFCGGVGRTDLQTGDTEALVRSLRKLAKLEVERLYPGHGPSVEKNARRHVLEAIEFMS